LDYDSAVLQLYQYEKRRRASALLTCFPLAITIVDTIPAKLWLH